jgi:hypothetical protein
MIAAAARRNLLVDVDTGICRRELAIRSVSPSTGGYDFQPLSITTVLLVCRVSVPIDQILDYFAITTAH